MHAQLNDSFNWSASELACHSQDCRFDTMFPARLVQALDGHPEFND
jgi:hypothetical protein